MMITTYYDHDGYLIINTAYDADKFYKDYAAASDTGKEAIHRSASYAVQKGIEEFDKTDDVAAAQRVQAKLTATHELVNLANIAKRRVSRDV
jgi:hypothetical protein